MTDREPMVGRRVDDDGVWLVVGQQWVKMSDVEAIRVGGLLMRTGREALADRKRRERRQRAKGKRSGE